MNKELQELYLDLMEVMAYRELQVPSDSGSEDEYFNMDIQSLQRAIALAYYELNYCKPEPKQNKKDRNRYRLNKKAKEKMYKKKEGWDCKPWRNHNKRGVPAARAKEHKFKRMLRQIPVGEENFSLKGCGYQHVYEWTWDID